MKRRLIFCAVLALVVGLPAAMFSRSTYEFANKAFAPSFTSVLSHSDSEHYTAAFTAQRKQDWQAADAALRLVDNQILRGHVLAERYLSRKYSPTADDLSTWLVHYRGLPQAYDMYQLASNRYGLKTPAVKKVEMMPNDNGARIKLSDAQFNAVWKQGISAYSKEHFFEAATAFDTIVEEQQSLSSGKISAAGFWAWRAHSKLGNGQRAEAALRVAASESRSFYGILAKEQLEKELGVNKEMPALSADEVRPLKRNPAVMRAMALVQTNRHDLAERELRMEYVNMDNRQRRSILQIARHLDLPVSQVSLTKHLEKQNNSLDLAQYPIPAWQPVGGFSVDPALIYALVRQESGFRANAISPAGASGLMQLMPATARMMDLKIGDRLSNASETERNITLGQGYIRHLLENSLVDNNVIFMLTSYNAGIGRLQEWKKTLNYGNDPLLFIEQIPYNETRHYVMQVMTNYWLYSEILGTKAPTLDSLAANDWPLYQHVS